MLLRIYLHETLTLLIFLKRIIKFDIAIRLVKYYSGRFRIIIFFLGIFLELKFR